MDVCPICKSGEVFIGNAMEFGLVVDCYAPCACPDPTDDDAPDDGLLPADLLAAWEPMGTAYDDFHRFKDATYEGC